ncbi:MAG: carboxypeptidase-like regulatory domain-containing protein, partial [Prevotellaceae bacterium]|nr:carboxypeptidase-like regulatory domain-containing protein [Prevotellaceae bacterium]
MRKKCFYRGFFILSFILFSQMAFGQPPQITGTVSDASTGETLIGVTVSEKGATNATITDIDGRYAITVRPGATLVFSYVGYETQELLAS